LRTRSSALRRRRTAALAGLVAVAAASFAAGAIGGGGKEGGSGGGGGTEEATPFALAPLPDLSARQLAGQRLIAGFDGRHPPRGLVRAIAAGRLAGVVLFADNVGGTRSTRRLLTRLQRIERPQGLNSPLLVMVDQEGGLVKRLDGPPDASAAEMGRRGRTFAERQGRATARLLRRNAINVDLAPVLDVARPGSAIGAEQRSFGGSPARVTDIGVAGFARGLQAGGTVPTAKHFPGFGAARVNTDAAAQTIDLSARRLRAVDEPPFRAFSEAGGEMVMLSLASYRAFGDVPAAFDRAIATRELRDRVGFRGVSVSDSLDAEAAHAFGGDRRVALAGARAGTDLLLYGDWRDALRAGSFLERALRRGRLDEDDFRSSVRRVLSLRGEMRG
jgi:beta-N-acetylhexosaminidase